MTACFRNPRSFVFAAGVATLLSGPLRAQEASLVPARASVSASSAPTAVVDNRQTAASTATPTGPTVEAAVVGARQTTPSVRESRAAAAPSGLGQPTTLIIVGGAAILAGLIIGGGAGYAIAIGGAVVGLIGLYQYLQ